MTERLRDPEWLEEKVRELSDEEIGELVGCSGPNVAYWRNKHGIEPVMTDYPELHDEEWLEEKLEDNNQTEIAEELGCTHSLVSTRVSQL